jgi:hypothetical protein
VNGHALYIVFGAAFHRDDIEQECKMCDVAATITIPERESLQRFVAEHNNSSRPGIFLLPFPF